MAGYESDVGGTNEIKIVVNMIDNVTKPLKNLVSGIKSIAKGYKQLVPFQIKMIKNQIKTNNAMVKMRKESNLFKKSMTSMMSSLFFFKALKEETIGLLNPAMDATGIFDVFGATLQTVFLPIALVIMDALLPIMQWFIDLPESAKLAIGAIVAATAAISTFIALKKAIDIFLFSNNIMLANLGTTFSEFSKNISTKVSELPTSFKIGLLIALAIQLNKTLKDLKGGDFDFGTALWDTLSTGFGAYAGLSMFKATAPYAGTIGIAVIAIVGVGFLLQSDFLSNLNIFLKGLWNEFAGAWNATNLSKLVKIGTYDMSGINAGSYGIGTYTPPPATNFGNLSGSSGVMSAGTGVTVNSPITINANISSGIDIKNLTNQISSQIRQDISKYSAMNNTSG